MSVNVIISSQGEAGAVSPGPMTADPMTAGPMTAGPMTAGPITAGLVTVVEDGAAIDVPAGASVRVEFVESEGGPSSFVPLTDLAAVVDDQDVLVKMPDGQSIVLREFAETFVEQALGTGLTAADQAPTSSAPEGPSQGLGPRISIDYVGDDTMASRVDLYFDKASEGSDGGVELSALFAALEAELGLSPQPDNTGHLVGDTTAGGPAIVGMNVIDQPLDLSDVLLQTSGTPTVSEIEGAADLSGGVFFAELATLWGSDDDSPAMNDNDVLINA